jgi:hypothetical protein
VEDLPFQEVEEILESVLNNYKIVEVIGEKGPEFILLRYPPAEEVLQSRCVRISALKEAREEGLPSMEDIDRLLETKSLIPEQDDERLSDLQDKLEGQKKLLQLTKITGRRAPIEEVIQRLNREIDELRAKGEAYYSLSQERKADEASLLYLTWAAVYSVSGDRYWESFDAFGKETDLFLRDSIRLEFVSFNRGLPTETIRFLARHNLWRVRYVASLKTGGSLFCRDLNDLTPDQLGLLYWSNYYQSIYEMMPDEQPDEDTIKDDEALDKYMERYAKVREKDKNESRIKRGGTLAQGQKLSAWDSGDELIITPANPSYMNLAYTEERVEGGEASEVEVVSPNSRRARNRAKSRRPQGRTR